MSRRNQFPHAILLAIALVGLLHTGLAAQDSKPVTSAVGEWPQFLGPNQNGISSETNLVDSWPQDGPKQLWRKSIGTGMSTVAVSGGKLFTLAQDGSNQFAIALDAKSGDEVWKQNVSPNYKNQMGDGPRATPAVGKNHVFVHTGEGVLAALDLKTGKIAWSKNLPKELDGKPIEYGISSSPLLIGDLVVVQPGVAGATVVACNQKTGDVVWKAGTGSAGYSSPVALRVGGATSIVTFSGFGAMGLSPKNGDQLWGYRYKTDYDCNTANPIAVGERVLISSGENHGSVLLSLKDNKPTPEWTSLGTGSVLRSEWQTPVLLNGHLYGFDNVGSAGPVTHFTCVDANSGKTVWQKKRFGKGNLIAADGKLFISTMKGELVLVAASPGEFKELARSKQGLVDTTRQAPVIVNGRLYLRGTDDVVCFAVGK